MGVDYSGATVFVYFGLVAGRVCRGLVERLSLGVRMNIKVQMGGIL